MIESFSQFRTDIVAANEAFQIWGPLLNAPFIAAILVFRKEVLSWAISLSTILSLIIAVNIHEALPLSRLIGVCHAVWLPILPFVVIHFLKKQSTLWFKIFLFWTMIMMTISLIFDTYDIYRFIFTANKTFNFVAP